MIDLSAYSSSDQKLILTAVRAPSLDSTLFSDGGVDLVEGGQLLILSTAPTVVNFPDANLEAEVRIALGIPEADITDIDMYALTSLDAASAGITDLAGLEYAVNIKSLILDNNEITELSPIFHLQKLEHLSLRNTAITDFGIADPKNNLHYLDIRGCDIQEISGLLNYKALQFVAINDTALDLLFDPHTVINTIAQIPGITIVFESIDGSPLPEITEQPQSVSFQTIEATYTFDVTANSFEPLSYQWYDDGEVIEGATQDTLTLSGEDLAGPYYVTVSNSWANTDSNFAVVSYPACDLSPSFAMTIPSKPLGNSQLFAVARDDSSKLEDNWATNKLEARFTFNVWGSSDATLDENDTLLETSQFLPAQTLTNNMECSMALAFERALYSSSPFIIVEIDAPGDIIPENNTCLVSSPPRAVVQRDNSIVNATFEVGPMLTYSTEVSFNLEDWYTVKNTEVSTSGSITVQVANYLDGLYSLTDAPETKGSTIFVRIKVDGYENTSTTPVE